MGKVIGIDLGTTTSCVSVVEGGKSVVIPNSEGRYTTPSVVAFTTNGEIKVGDSAKRQAVTNAKNTISSIKRFMGENYDQVDKEIKRVSYDVVRNKNNAPRVKIEDREYSPQEISAYTLQKMKSTAEDYLGTTVSEAVITVPAYFSDSQRTATKEAGEIAGLKVLRIINEPTAAALAYGLDKSDKDKTIAVYDFGGGTFDISVLELGDGVFEVKSTNGDTHLGGDDIDNAVVDMLADEFKKTYNIDLRKDVMALQRLKEAAEKAKIELSSSTSTEINLPYIMPVDGIPQHLIKTLTRSEFEKIIDKYVQATIEPCQKALSDAGLKASDIDEVILVGGSTRIPAIQDVVEKIFGKAPNKSLNPDQAVAEGAAIQGAVLAGDINDVLLLDINSISLGIETYGNIFSKLIDSGVTIPTEKEEVYSTASDNQPSVEIHVLQGERPMAYDNKTLGKFHLDGIQPARKGEPQILVKFSIDANGILTVTAKDKGTNQEQSIRIESSTGLSKEEIEKIKADAEAHAEEDKKKKETVEKLNNADSMVFQIRKEMDTMGDKMTDNEKADVEESLKKMEDVVRSRVVDNIDNIQKEILDKFTPIRTRIYEQSKNEPVFNEATNESADNFEEVK